MNFCRVCKSNKSKILNVEEKHHGTFEKFEYIHCLACDSLTIKNIPHNLCKYYQSTNYYSIQEKPKTRTLKNWIENKYWQHITSKKSRNFVGYIVEIFKKPSEENFFKIISNTNINSQSKILDIGCGRGDLLKRFHQFGYCNVLGLDPNVENDIYYEKEKLVIKSKVEEYVKKSNSQYDLIMFNHSFEHLPNPEEVLDCIKKLSHKDTYYLIRIPLSGSYAFEQYRENWVQLDPPRHLYLYSEKGIRIMLENHNFEIQDIIYDSTEFQFWGSEQYLKNISLISEMSYSQNYSKSIFTEEDILNFREKAKNLNKEKEGDQAAFIFKIKSN